MPQITIKNAWICQIKKERVLPRFADLHIDAGRIAAIQPLDFQRYVENRAQQQTETPDSPANIIDAAGRVITVPLVNFHDHFYARLAKGLPIRGPLDSFIHILENLWWKLDRALDLDMVRACGQMAVLEAIANGVTYVFDHHASPLCIMGSLPAIADVLKAHHLRGVLCYETSDRNGSENSQLALEENYDFIQNHSDEDVKGMVGLHAPFTLSDETLKNAAILQQKLRVGIHIHLAEDKHEVAYSRRKYNRTPTRRLQEFQILDSVSILAHGIQLAAEDHRIISQCGSAIAYCPDSNMNNAVGLPRFAVVPANIPILMGTDGMHADIARSAKQLFLLFRHQGNGFDNAFEWMRKLYFDQIRFVRRYFPDYPSLFSGDRADLIIWDYVPPTPLDESNFFGHFIYGITEYPVHSAMQKGNLLLRDFRILNGDLDITRREICRQGKRLWQKFQGK